ncbi:MAG: protein-disulfide reductase DsbD [Gallionella sp.]|jgi:thiol:disulfide interchange protein DsbD|nr:protein-disulfide reductase DsbD [Gallionella sp.]
MRFAGLILLYLLNTQVHAESLLDRLPLLGGNKKPVFLVPDQAFKLSVLAQDANTLQANFSITPGYYLYRNKIIFKPLDDAIKFSEPSFPKGEIKQDPNFGAMEVFHHSFRAGIPLIAARPQDKISLVVEYQGCSEQGLCYPPIEKTFVLNLPASLAQAAVPGLSSLKAPEALAVPTEDSKIKQLFKSGSFWLVVTFFFGAGFLLAFTPCVFPMIPILSGIIVGRGHRITKVHAFILSLSYVLGMAITYALAGVAAGFSGDLISNALQTPWVLGSFAAVFVLLSLSMFGLYELQLPTALQSKLADTSNRLHGGHLSGVFIMGALSAIIMGPCVAAPLAGALLYISQTHDAVLGGMALFALALGMGAPLLLIGTSAAVLLPKAGAWMDAVKRFFGVMLLALAIWIVQPLLPIGVQMLLWALLLILTAAYLHALDALPQHASGWHKMRKGVGLLLLLLGISYLVGALSGARDILRPLGAIGKAELASTAPLQWGRIKDLADLDRRIAGAGSKTVVLDFYADWCVSCKEMERYTFTDPAVQARLKSAVLLQVDVTANTLEDKVLLKQYGLFGPPATLFFDAQGKEVQDARVVGYQDAAQFVKSLQNVKL